jgi:hypothetical protein
MTGKKIEFLKKPTIKNTNEFIDNWVSGNTQLGEPEKILKRTTIYLPNDVHKELKMKAALENTSMTDIIINSIKSYLK